MGVLVNIINNKNALASNFDINSKQELIALLKEKIECSITENGSIIVDVETPLVSCRNTFSVEDYEIDSEYLYLNNSNFELHINLNQIEIKYDKTNDENFILMYNDTGVVLHFLN